MNLVLLIYFCLSSVKYLLFGVTHMLHTSIHDYSQYSVINANLHDINSTTFTTYTSVMKWMFFGLSPNSTDTKLISVMYNSLYDGDNRDRRELSNNTSQDEIHNIINWFEDNRFGIALTSMILFVSLIIFGHFILNVFVKKKINNILSHGVVTQDGSIASIRPNYWNSSYINFIISILLISYCNITTVTLYELININSVSVSYAMFACCIFVLYVVIFPLGVFKFLLDSSNNLYDRKTMNNFGALYLSFKQERSKFICVILIRQILYAITINLSLDFGYIQNSLMLMINIGYLALLIYMKPYVKKTYQIQSLILTSTLIMVSLINYGIIANNGDSSFIWFLSTMIIQTFSLVIYFSITMYEYIKKAFTEPIILTTIDRSSTDKDNIPLIPVDQTHDTKYQRESTIRLTQEIEENEV